MSPRLLLLVPWLIGSSCQADSWKSEIHPVSKGPFPTLPPTTLDYRVSWKGMLDAGSVRLEFAPRKHKKPGSYVVSSTSRSLGPASSLFPYESSFWSEIQPSSLSSRRFYSTEKDRRETIESKTIFTRPKTGYTEITRNLRNGNLKTRSRSFHFSPVHDIFSAMLFVRSQNLAKGDQITLVTQPFATPYLIRIRVVDHVVHQQQPAIHLRLSMNKINRNTLRLEPYKKMKREASLWLSNDQHRVPLELRASIFIGDIRATLTKMRQP